MSRWRLALHPGSSTMDVPYTIHHWAGLGDGRYENTQLLQLFQCFSFSPIPKQSNIPCVVAPPPPPHVETIKQARCWQWYPYENMSSIRVGWTFLRFCDSNYQFSDRTKFHLVQPDTWTGIRVCFFVRVCRLDRLWIGWYAFESLLPLHHEQVYHWLQRRLNASLGIGCSCRGRLVQHIKEP